MHQKSSDGALRYWDFTLLDMLAMQLSFLLSHAILNHGGFLYLNPPCRMLAIIFFSAQMALGLHSDSYDHIYTRDNFAEFTKLIVQVVEIWLLPEGNHLHHHHLPEPGLLLPHLEQAPPPAQRPVPAQDGDRHHP